MFNAHCHLELSFLKGKIPPGTSFVDWLEIVVEEKRKTSKEEILTSALKEYQSMQENGDTAFWDIDSMGILPSLSGRKIFKEIIRFKDEEEFDLANGIQISKHTDLIGISPHSPYTTTPALLEAASRFAKRNNIPLCIHCAETPEETDMIMNGKGDLFDFLKPYLPEDWRPPGLRPIEYLDQLGCLSPVTFLVHCNDITKDEIRTIRSNNTKVIVCPGTHTYFERDYFPLSDLMRAGVPFLIGTDSLASNHELKMHRELEIASEMTGFTVDQIIEAALKN